MAIIGVGGARKRPQYSHKLFQAVPTRGGVSARGWPRARPGRGTNYAASIRQRLATTVATVKRLHPREANPMLEAIAEHARTHTGVRGSANIRYRDIETQRLAGRLWAVSLPDGRMIYPAAVRQDMSQAIDWIEPRVGSMLTRVANGWRPTNACVVGAVFTVTPEGEVPGCCPPATIPKESEIADNPEIIQ